MCVKASLLVLFLCLFMHASYSTSPSSALPTHNKSPAQKIEEKLKLKKVGRNGRVTFEHNLRSKSTREELCKKNKAIQGGTSRLDRKSSLHKALLQFTKSEDSRWRHLNVREMELRYSSISSEENLSETDYQPPHRKSPIHN